MDSASPGEASPVIEAPEGPHPHGHSGVKWFDAAMTVSVLLVSVTSVLISLHTGSAMNELVHENSRLVRASSTPLLDFQTGNANGSGKRVISFAIANYGTGPARIDWLELRYKGVPQESIMSLANSAAGTHLPLVKVMSQASSHTLIRAGDERSFMRWDRPAESDTEALKAWTTMDDARFDIEVETCYCSLLDECWQANLKTNVTRAVAECRPQEHVSFGDLSHGVKALRDAAAAMRASAAAH